MHILKTHVLYNIYMHKVKGSCVLLVTLVGVALALICIVEVNLIRVASTV